MTAPLIHDHNYLSADHDKNTRRTATVAILTVITMAVEIAAGWWTGSLALLADGIHMGTHAAALGIGAAAYAMARRHARNPTYSFGTGKVGDLAAFASALILAFVGLGIIWESVARLIHPTTVAYGDAMLVAILGLIVNLASVALLGGFGAGHSHDHAGGHDHHHDHDLNIRSAIIHVATDALTSVLAIIALALGWAFAIGWADPVVGLIGAAVILWWATGLIRASAMVLLDHADPTLVARIRDMAGNDAAILDLHVWRLGPTGHAAIISLHGPVDCETLRTRLYTIPGLRHVTVEVRNP